MPPQPPFHDSGEDRSTLSRGLRELADLLEDDPAECPDAAKRERVALALSVAGRLDAAIAREVGVFDANTVWAGDGCRSASGWLQSRTETSKARATSIVLTARHVRSCPVVEAAWADGSIGTAKVSALLRARSVHPQLFAEEEAGLVADVTPKTVAAAQVRLAQWMEVALATLEAEAAARTGDDPEDASQADPRAENSWFLSQSLGGRWLGDANYDPVSGAEIHGAIAALIDQKFHAGVYRADDGMTAAQRRAECHLELVLRGADPTQTKHSEARPSVSVEIDGRTLADIPATDAVDATSRRCQLANGTPIARSSAERLLCRCRLTALATKLAADGTIEVVGITDLLRDATAAQRKALRRRDGGCVVPGCDAPFDWCDAHHLWQHEDLGPTLLHNLVLLCKHHHHHRVHEGGWHLWREPGDDLLYLRRPDGTAMSMSAHGELVPLDAPGPSPAPPRKRNGPPRHLTRAERTALEERRARRRPPPC